MNMNCDLISSAHDWLSHVPVGKFFLISFHFESSGFELGSRPNRLTDTVTHISLIYITEFNALIIHTELNGILIIHEKKIDRPLIHSPKFDFKDI